MINEITLVDGEVVKISPNLTAWTLFNLEKEGVIGKSFLSTLLDTRGGAGNVDLLDTFYVVYAAYRQANVSDYMNFEAFMQKYEVDMTEAFKIFGSVLKKQKDKNNMAKGFQQKAGKKA
ncbi:hypothetical protein [Bacillus cereus]|uniref:hypothetical protein n=1 Tax=Bacillus cereus TaxID=1396 RepID=UPI0021126A6B|nr:hypothetical protein [Bacillus cereus]